MADQRDIAGRIALWLFRIGILWALILAPVTLFLLFERVWGLWRVGVYLLIGFAVWGGWYWRSRKERHSQQPLCFGFFPRSSTRLTLFTWLSTSQIGERFCFSTRWPFMRGGTLR